MVADNSTTTTTTTTSSVALTTFSYDSILGWDEPLTDQELEHIDTLIQTATSSNKSNGDNRKRRRLPTSLSLSPSQFDKHLSLPTMSFKGKVLYSRTCKEVEKAVAELSNKIHILKSIKGQVAVGFDIEWRPTFKKGASPRKTAVMQICGDTSCCYVLHIFHSGIPQTLKAILEDNTILKVGAGIGNDAIKMLKDYDVSMKAFEDLSNLANLKLGNYQANWSLSSLARTLIHEELQKPRNIRLGNWEAVFLSKQQLQYAATDAFASWYLYQVLKSLPDPEEGITKNTEEHLAPELV